MRKSVAGLAVLAVVAASGAGLAVPAQASDGTAEAKGIVAKASLNPTTLGNLAPIGKAIPKGKYVITITGNTNASRQLNAFTIEGGHALGWKVESIVTPGTVDALRAGFEQALAKKPDGIAVSGMETDSFGDLYEKAAAQGIAIVCSACMSKPGQGLLDSHIAGPKMLQLWGRMVAAYTVASVKGTPNVQMFGITSYPIMTHFDNAYRAYLRKFSPNSTATFTVLDTNTIDEQVTGVYKANPSTSFMSSDLGDFFNGVPDALTAAGAKPGSMPQMGGLTASIDNIRDLKAKTSNAWTGYPLPIVGYSVIDSFARYWTNTPFATATLPTQLLTQKNVNRAVLTATGEYLGVRDFRSQFKKIWGLR